MVEWSAVWVFFGIIRFWTVSGVDKASKGDKGHTLKISILVDLC